MYVVDHLGKDYRTLEDMCATYGVTARAYSRRRQNGMSIQMALCTPLADKHPKESTDHYGNAFPSERAMCLHYGRDPRTYRARRDAGWSLKDALEVSPVH